MRDCVVVPRTFADYMSAYLAGGWAHVPGGVPPDVDYWDSKNPGFCLNCPQLPAIPAMPDRVETTPNTGWNAGANSVAQIAGDVHVLDTMDAPPNGIVIGLKTTRAGQVTPAAILHGLYFYRNAGKALVEAREVGARVGPTMEYAAGATWEIRRVGAWVTYWLNGELLAKSPARTLGPVLVNACLYSAPDTVP